MSSTTSATRSDRPPTAGRPWPLAIAPLAAILLAAVASGLCAQLLAIWPEVLATRLRWPAPSTLEIDSLVAAPLLATGAALAAWWSVSLALVTASLAAERLGMRSAALLRCIHVVAPRTLRRLAVAGVGAGLTFSTLPAQAAEEPPDLGWTVTQQTTATAPPADAASASPSTPALSDPTGLGTPAPLAEPAVAGIDGFADAVGPAGSAGPVPDTLPLGDAARSGPAVSGAGASAPSSGSGTGAGAGSGLSSGTTTTGSASATEPRSGPGSSTESDSSAAAPADSPGVRPDLAPGVVVVAHGDTLWDLAAAELPATATTAQIATAWQVWYALNVAVIGADPDLLQPGQILQIPAPG